MFRTKPSCGFHVLLFIYQVVVCLIGCVSWLERSLDSNGLFLIQISECRFLKTILIRECVKNDGCVLV